MTHYGNYAGNYHSKMWGGPEKFLSTVVYNGVVYSSVQWAGNAPYRPGVLPA